MKESPHLTEIRRLDPVADAQRIVFLDACFEFPWDLQRSLELAFYRTFAVPSIAELLDSTGEFVLRAQKRYDDTQILLSAFASTGYDSDFGTRAIRRMNQIHGSFEIPNELFVYVLSTMVFEPVRWNQRVGWRPSIETERLAAFHFWREVGKRMAIRDIPESLRRARGVQRRVRAHPVRLHRCGCPRRRGDPRHVPHWPPVCRSGVGPAARLRPARRAAARRARIPAPAAARCADRLKPPCGPGRAQSARCRPAAARASERKRSTELPGRLRAGDDQAPAGSSPTTSWSVQLGPVAQWIERQASNLRAVVRFHPGLPKFRSFKPTRLRGGRWTPEPPTKPWAALPLKEALPGRPVRGSREPGAAWEGRRRAPADVPEGSMGPRTVLPGQLEALRLPRSTIWLKIAWMSFAADRVGSCPAHRLGICCGQRSGCTGLGIDELVRVVRPSSSLWPCPMWARASRDAYLLALEGGRVGMASAWCSGLG